MLTTLIFWFVFDRCFSATFACDCSVPIHPCQTFDQADILASGSVLQIIKGSSQTRIVFRIQEGYKGGVQSKSEINFTTPSNDCGLDFKKGSYLISLIETQNGTLLTDQCLFNQRFKSLSKEIAKWLKSDELVSCSVCQDGSQPVVCLVNPCDVQKDRCPDADRCVPDYCGGCNARFYNEKGDEICRSGQQNCSVGLCDPCEYGYVYDSRGCQTCQCVSPPNNNTCSDGSQPVACFDNPCATQKQICPEATQCVVNYCGGCNAKYYNQDGRQVCQSNQCPVVNCQQKCEYGFIRDSRGCQTCQCVPAPTCTNGSRPVTCLQNPCNLQDQQCPNATRCVPDYCGGCNAKYYNQSGVQICFSNNQCPILQCQQRCEYGYVYDSRGCQTCQCVSPPNNNTCSDGSPPKSCAHTFCTAPSKQCPSSVRCTLDPCSKCSPIYYNKKGLQICRSLPN